MAEIPGYFPSHYDNVKYPLDTGTGGLRVSQIGALHAVSAHFTLSTRPAVVVLPTGTGKTAVLALAPFLLRAQRALIITQSTFVRDQIAEDVSVLATLKRVGALPGDVPPPATERVETTMNTAGDWEALRAFDVVVATPHRVSPAYGPIVSPPVDLFDVILVDEAHHSPAKTWAAVIAAFPKARFVLLTATPFRRDGKEIKGKDIYVYPIQRAFDDDVYGEMEYIGLEGRPDEENDIVLARRVAEVFREDERAGYRHALMVRAESRRRADDLKAVYADHTDLRLDLVHSRLSRRTTERVVKRLRDGELDGVICVNMLGEGFDLPRLKLAALHAPHRSLAVTLQFLGRFARVNGEGLGTAKFLAMKDEIGEDLDALFVESPAWGRKIRAVGQDRIGEEVEARAFLDTFEDVIHDPGVLDDLSLGGFTVFNHVKVFRVHGGVDLAAPPKLRGFETLRTWIAEENDTMAFIVRESIRPDWAGTDGLDRIEHHLFVVYHDKVANLLFICGSHREESAYRDITASLVDGRTEPLSLSKINRVLRSFADLELYNVGMRNRALRTLAESYRQISGGAAHTGIDKGDGALYHRGHIFGKGRTATGATTIGLSSLSKIWRLERTKIPGLVAWCRRMARDIENPAAFTTGMELDHLDAGRDIEAFPEEVVLGADWQDTVYTKPLQLDVQLSNGQSHSTSPLSVDLSVDRERSDTTAVFVQVASGEGQTVLKAVLEPHPHVTYADDDQPRWTVKRGFVGVDLAEYLTDTPLRFHLADGSLVERRQLFEAPAEDTPYDAEGLMEVVPWSAHQVDIQCEFGAAAPLKSVQDWLGHRLAAGDDDIVFFDHRAGECADFLTAREGDDGVPVVSLYHCKGAGGAEAGDRVGDLYDVCGQATKCVRWRSKKVLIKHIKRRLRSGSAYVKGNEVRALELLEGHVGLDIALNVYVVQPGVEKARLSEKMSMLLSTTSRGLVSMGCARLRVLSS